MDGEGDGDDVVVVVVLVLDMEVPKMASAQILPVNVSTAGWYTFVMNLMVGGLKGYCGGNSTST